MCEILIVKVSGTPLPVAFILGSDIMWLKSLSFLSFNLKICLFANEHELYMYYPNITAGGSIVTLIVELTNAGGVAYLLLVRE